MDKIGLGFFNSKQIDSQITNDVFDCFVAAFMTAILKGREGDVWIGLSTVGQGGNPREFVWDDLTTLEYTNWAMGQPDGPPV